MRTAGQMTDPLDIFALIQVRLKRILDLAELALPAEKFERFRTLVLDEFGHKGLRGELAARDQGKEWQGKGRNQIGKEGGVP